MKLGEILTEARMNKKIFLRGALNFRTSQLGRCHRAIQYAVVGVKQEEPPPKTKEMWEERSRDEGTIIRILKKTYKIKESGNNQVTYARRWLKHPKVIFSCTPDGRAKKDKEWIPLEVKSLNPFRFEAIKSQDNLSREYFMQIQGEMILTGKQEALCAIGNSKTKTDVKHFLVTKDDRVEKWIARRTKYVLSFIEKDKWIYPEFLPGSEDCRWCLYKKKCSRDVYKGWNLKYNDKSEIDDDDFDLNEIGKLSKYLSVAIDEYEDSKLTLLRSAHKLKPYLLRRKCGQLISNRRGKKFDVSLEQINRILEEFREHNRRKERI